MKIYNISEFKQDEFTIKMDKFAKRANRLGLAFGYTLESTSESFYRMPFSTDKVYYTVYHYSVYGESPVINGYSFLAKIESIDNGVNLIHSHNTEYDFTSYRTCNLTCEHCNINRNRNFYYLVQNEVTKKVKMLGGNCLAQYIEQPNAERIAEFYNDALGIEFQNEESEYSEKVNQSKVTFKISDIVSQAVAIVNQYGYTSVKNEDFQNKKIATKTLVMNNFFYTGKDKINPSDEDKEQAESIIKAVVSDLEVKTKLTDYEYTIITLLNNGRMQYHHAGYVVSIVALYNRMMDDKRVKETTKQSDYVGSVGEKFSNITATVIKESQSDASGYGISYIFTFKDSNDNILVWFSSNNVCDLGNNVILTKGTIKGHKEYNGVKQTIITRCKIEIIK